MPPHVALGLLSSLLLLAGPARAQRVDRTGADRHAGRVVPASHHDVPEIRPDERPRDKKDDENDPAGSPVPEPMQLAVFGSGLLALAVLLSRRRQLRGRTQGY